VADRGRYPLPWFQCVHLRVTRKREITAVPVATVMIPAGTAVVAKASPLAPADIVLRLHNAEPDRIQEDVLATYQGVS
jgi:hypothetical protein